MIYGIIAAVVVVIGIFLYGKRVGKKSVTADNLKESVDALLKKDRTGAAASGAASDLRGVWGQDGDPNKSGPK